MKLLSACIIVSVFLLVLMTGCTNQTQTEQKAVTTVPTPESAAENTIAPATTIQTQEQTPVTDPRMLGLWYLKLMSEQNGAALVQMINPQITANFDTNSSISGNSGCNNYHAVYTLTGKPAPNGKEIKISPIASTKKTCTDDNTENTYLEILQGAISYQVNVNQELSIMDNKRNSLVYQRTPYSETAVPWGS